MATEETDLLETVDALTERLRWSAGIVSLIVDNPHAEDTVRDSADAVSRHLQESLKLIRDLPVRVKSTAR